MDGGSGNEKYAIHAAARDGDVRKVESLLNANPKLLNLHDEDERVPLHWACSYNHLPIISLLLTNPSTKPSSQPPDPDVKDGIGWTPLMISSSVKDGEEAVRLLLSREADANAKNAAGQVALHFAASKNHLDVVRLLLGDEGKASARVKDRRGQLPLHRAAAVGSIPVLRLLLEKNSPVDSSDVDGMTALHHAIAEGHGDAAVFLLQKGADAQKKDREDRTPLEIAPDDKVRDYIKQAAEREGIELP